ncbi:MAG: acetyl-CoA carboxylase, carboxyltransferase subunit beta [Deferribacteraceae bacterium]|jgi:acetyl-CoA carboxylase carboxyl transferase subunit beta|nr:acetyl-CoA carboxylase, carboxyltransferase subunit beta [Deferribacteraceae bacterium]
MGLRDFFLTRITKVSSEPKKEIKENLWTKCVHCGEICYKQEVESLLNTCPICGFHFKISAMEKIKIIVDENSFEPINETLCSLDPLKFKDSKKYPERVKAAQKKTGLNDAFISGRALVDGMPVNIGALEFNFMGGSMGSAAGEAIARLVEDAVSRRCHVITISSSGGARMQESILSLMQMAKTAAALARLNESGLGHISVFTNPTTGGVTASYSMLGDINISEPGALIGFAGARVIKSTIRQELPPGFQTAEFVQNHGMVDLIVHRLELRKSVSDILNFFG